jgi:hypothetical protein
MTGKVREANKGGDVCQGVTKEGGHTFLSLSVFRCLTTEALETGGSKLLDHTIVTARCIDLPVVEQHLGTYSRQ